MKFLGVSWSDIHIILLGLLLKNSLEAVIALLVLKHKNNRCVVI